MQNIHLIICKRQVMGQIIHRHTSNSNMQNILCLSFGIFTFLRSIPTVCRKYHFLDLTFNAVHHPECIDKQVSLFSVDHNDIIVAVQVLVDCKDGQHLRPIAGPGVAVLILIVKFHIAAFRMVRHQITDGFTKFGVGFQHNLSDGNAVGIAAFIGKKDAHRTAQNSGSCTDHQCEYQNNATGSNQIYQGIHNGAGCMGKQLFQLPE